MRLFVFGYASLLDLTSLARTIPDLSEGACIPSVAKGHLRRWSVAFPNNGSQADKSYFDKDGERPSFVLFVNLERRQGEVGMKECVGANGILIPVAEDTIQRIAGRELRYRLVDITSSIAFYPEFVDRTGGPFQVFTSAALPKFTRAQDIKRGVISREYKDTIEAGVRHWEQRVPGFLRDYQRSTVQDPGVEVHDLTRVDYLL